MEVSAFPFDLNYTQYFAPKILVVLLEHIQYGHIPIKPTILVILQLFQPIRDRYISALAGIWIHGTQDLSWLLLDSMLIYVL